MMLRIQTNEKKAVISVFNRMDIYILHSGAVDVSCCDMAL